MSWGTRLTAFLFFFRSTKPEETSFSRIPARVAGVPSPLRSASSGISFAPAFSMAESSVSSVYRAGGFVFPSSSETSKLSMDCPSVIGGSTLSFCSPAA